MNLEKSTWLVLSLVWYVLLASLLCMTGCGPTLSSPGELAAFRDAGPVRPTVDLDRLVQAKLPTEPYRVVKGDVLELYMPEVMRAVFPELIDRFAAYGRTETHLSRVSEAGTITLPVAGEIRVAGKMLCEIEAAIVGAYYPKCLINRPSVVALVKEYQTHLVSVMGAVKEPGQYALRSDEMSLVALLMKAGGIEEEGASVIRIRRAGATDKVADPVVLPVKGFRTPFADVPLKAGDVVEVEEYIPRELMVMGLVNKPGVYPYPPQTRYNLMQALAFAGGIDMRPEARYAKVYRQMQDGKVVAAVLRLDSGAFTEASNMVIKPGDVVAVEHTARTRTRQFFMDFMRIGFGLSAGYQLNPE